MILIKSLIQGSGSGRDCYVMSQFVGKDGHVHGVDMTDEQLAVSRNFVDTHMEKFFGSVEKPNVTFHQGFIEDMNFLPSASVDIVISNCVLNMTPKKDLVLKEIYRILKPGGELFFSDVYADRRFKEDVTMDPLCHSEGFGALYVKDFENIAREVGFRDPRKCKVSPLTIRYDEISKKVGSGGLTSIHYRLFKLDSLVC